MTLPRIGFDRASVRTFLRIGGDLPCVYRIRAADGTLVYLGATVRPRGRMLEHLLDPAKTDGAYIEFEFCRNTTEMARKEKAAIADETSVCNLAPGRRHGAWRAQLRS